MKNFSKIAFCGWLLFSGTLAYADPIPALANIPNNLNAGQKTKLTQQKQVLENELKNFQAAAGAFNAKPAKDQTDQDYGALQSQRSGYIQSATTFNQEVDSSVVDARNVPSGLPKSVEDQIPHTPSGNRVRKGFEAIQSHDWKVALAWFQDALNHDPNNAGIARLVDLAQYTLKYEEGLKSGALPKTAAPISMAAVDKYLEDRNDAQFQAQWSDFVNHYLPQHPELTRSILNEINATNGSQPENSNKETGNAQSAAGSAQLSAADVRQRVVDLRRSAKKFDQQATENMAYSFMLPGGDTNQAGQRMRNLAVVQSEASAAIITHADMIERCKCTPPLELPEDTDIKFLFPLAR